MALSTRRPLPVGGNVGLVSGELAAAPAQGSYLGHEHAELRQVGPKGQIIAPENTVKAKSCRDALTSEDGNGSDTPARAPLPSYLRGRSARVR